MSHKTEAAGVVLALAVLTSAARAETVELTDAQMDQITAGAFEVVNGANLRDSSGTLYSAQSPQPTTQYKITEAGMRPATEVGTVWTGNIMLFLNRPGVPPYGVGTLTGPGGPRDGGFAAPA